MGLPKLAFEVGRRVLHCWVLPVGSSVVWWEGGGGCGQGQEKGLFSQSHFDLLFAVLWDHIVTGMEA